MSRAAAMTYDVYLSVPNNGEGYRAHLVSLSERMHGKTQADARVGTSDQPDTSFRHIVEECCGDA